MNVLGRTVSQSVIVQLRSGLCDTARRVSANLQTHLVWLTLPRLDPLQSFAGDISSTSRADSSTATGRDECCHLVPVKFTTSPEVRIEDATADLQSCVVSARGGVRPRRGTVTTNGPGKTTKFTSTLVNPCWPPRMMALRRQLPPRQARRRAIRKAKCQIWPPCGDIQQSRPVPATPNARREQPT